MNPTIKDEDRHDSNYVEEVDNDVQYQPEECVVKANQINENYYWSPE